MFLTHGTDIAEFSGDVTKWVVYDTLVGLNAFPSAASSAATTTMSHDSIMYLSGIFGEEISCAAYGAMASVAGLYVNKLLNEARKSLRKRSRDGSPSKPVDAVQFKFALSEGAALFGSYNFIQHVLAEVELFMCYIHTYIHTYIQ